MSTWTERFTAVGALLKAAWWILVLVALMAGALLLSRACDRADTAEAALRRANETATAEKLGLIVVHEVKEQVQLAKIKAMSAESAGFAAAWQAAEAKLEARPVIVVQASTGPVPLSTPEVVHSGKPVDAGGKNDSGLPAATACRLSPGDQGEIVVRAAVRQAKEGTRDVVGHAQAFRVSPRELLFEGSFEAPVTEALSEPVPLDDEIGWGGGALAGIGTSGLTGGVMILSPPLLGDHLSAVGTVQLGAGPSGSILAGLVWR